MVDFHEKDRYTIDDLLRIVHILRAPGGCPWDREQTHVSICKDLIEETYEVVDAINQNDAHLLCEELGDVLLQVAMHAQMETEVGSFGFDDVADGICKKLIYRHPHVFGNIVAEDAGAVLQNWEKLKVAEKHREAVGDNLDSVPRALPALMRARKLQKRVRDAGMDFSGIENAMAALRSEVDELAEALLAGTTEEASKELGDVLFSAVNVSRFIKCDAEEELTTASDRFTARVKAMDALAAKQGKTLQLLSEEEMDALWQQAKIVAAE